MNWKENIKDWAPPAILKLLCRAATRNTYKDDNYRLWKEAQAACTGYDAAPVLDKVLTATLAVKNGDYAYERDSVLFKEVEYNWPLLCALLAASNQHTATLSVLDFGGALGSSYFQHRDYLQNIVKFDWNVIEQNHYVTAGKKQIQDDHLSFYANIEDYLQVKRPDIVLLSSVLQYLPDPISTLNSVSEIGAKILFIDRTPFTAAKKERIITQHVPKKIYDASYPMWLLKEENVAEALSESWTLKSTHACPEGTAYTNKGDAFTYKGFTFESSQ